MVGFTAARMTAFEDLKTRLDRDPTCPLNVRVWIKQMIMDVRKDLEKVQAEFKRVQDDIDSFNGGSK